MVQMLAFPLYTHEQSKVCMLHPLLKAGDLLVGDRAFCSFVHMVMIVSRGAQGLFRIHQKTIVDFRPHRKHRRRYRKGEKVKDTRRGTLHISPFASPLTATAASSTEIDLNWNNNSTAATGFTIKHSTDGTTFTTVDTVSGNTTTSYNNTGLTPGTNYWYEVIATTSSASSAPSGSATAITMPANLGGLTAASNSTTQAGLSWTPVTGASGYEIDRKDSSGDWEIYDSVDSGSANGYTDTGVSDGTTYTYRVLPYNDSGTSDESGAPTASATTQLIAPTNVNAVALSSTGVEIVWDNQSSSETGFEVQRSTDGSNFTDLGSTAAGVTNYVDSTASPNTAYWYRVKSTNSAAGSSAPSGSAPATTPAVPPADTAPTAPTLAANGVSTSEIDLTWAAPTDGSNLELEEKAPGDDNFAVVSIPSQTTNASGSLVYAMTGLFPDAQYSFRLRADLNGQAVYSPAASAATQAAASSGGGGTTPVYDFPTPTDFTISQGNGQEGDTELGPINYDVTVQTPAPTDPYAISIAPNARVQVELTGMDPYHVTSSLYSPELQTGYLPTGQTDFNGTIVNSPYGYQAEAAVITSGEQYISHPSNSVTVTTSGPYPAAPVLTSAAAGAGQVLVSWTPLPAGETIELFEAVNGQATFLTNGSGSSQGTPAVAGAKIFAIAENASGQFGDPALSLYSNFVDATGNNLAPAQPHNLSATPFNGSTGSGIRLLWDNNSNNETGFTIQRSTDPSFPTAGTQTLNNGNPVGADVTYYTDTASSTNTIEAGTTYYYRVEATNDVGNSTFSPTASATLTLPTVSVRTLLDNANFAGTDGHPQDGYFDFHRTGDVGASLTADISAAGTTAVAGQDYSGTLPASVTFAAGVNDVVVPIVPANGAPAIASVVDVHVADGTNYTAASGTTQVNTALHGLTVALDGGASNDVLIIGSDGQENLQPLTFTVPGNAPTGTEFTLSIGTSRNSNAANLVDVWKPSQIGDTTAAPLLGDGNDSYSWTVGESGASEPTTTLDVGAINGSTFFRDIWFTLTAAGVAAVTGSASTTQSTGEGLEILYNGHNIAGQSAAAGNVTTTVVVGQKVLLQAQLKVPGPPIASAAWHVGGDTVAAYLQAPDLGIVASTAKYSNKPTLTVYWIHAGEVTVSVNAAAGARNFPAQTELQVVSPTATVTTITGHPSILQIRDTAKLGFFGDLPSDDPRAPLPNWGIKFFQTVTPTPGFTGTTSWLQTVYAVYQAEGAAGDSFISSGGGLDTGLPYPIFDPPLNTDDSPCDRDYADPLVTRADQTDFWAHMYLMFQPSLPGSIPVPLKVVNWDWHAMMFYVPNYNLWMPRDADGGTWTKNPQGVAAAGEPEWHDLLTGKVNPKPEPNLVDQPPLVSF
jgi:fibronectin type 3 domain-containing protein